MRYPKVCPEWQCAFRDWLAANPGHLPVRPESIRRTRSHVSFGFAGITPAIRVVLTKDMLDVVALRDGECVDLLLALDVNIQRQRSGRYRCSACESVGDLPAQVTEFPSRPALWCDHLYEPLAHWVESSLLKASRLNYTSEPEGWKAARLVADAERCESEAIGMKTLSKSSAASVPSCSVAPADKANAL